MRCEEVLTLDTAIDKAIAVLECLEAAAGSQSLAEITATTGLPKPTVHRILSTLERHAFVRKLPDRNYAFGTRIIALGIFAASQNSLVTAARPLLDRLVVSCGETVHLGVLEGTALLYLDRREPVDAAVRLATLPSPLTSLHASAAGKVLLAYGDSELQEAVLAAGLVRYNARTIVDADVLAAELETIRARGFAVNEEERNEGVRAIGVPVRNRAGAVVAALSAAGPVQRVDDEKLHQMQGLLAAAAAELSMAVPL
jgi:DNA-binding IclR family transcriptional regulator